MHQLQHEDFIDSLASMRDQLCDSAASWHGMICMLLLCPCETGQTFLHAIEGNAQAHRCVRCGAAMIALLAGSPDTDVVLSEAELTEVISCLAGQKGEDLYDEGPVELKVECESYDLRVGERASNKRQRCAGNAAQAALDSARGTRSQGRRKEGLHKKEPLPPGWVVKIITIEDGRRCE